ncbi:MAG: carbonic anhydrase [Candidatus Eisenbacteria bacterium]
MQHLVRGLLHFQADVFPERRRQFEALQQGQAPDACLIACADSRVDPSLLLSSQPGELFVIRNAGNLVPQFPTMQGGTAASVEFATSVLGVRDMVVCGHSHCGAIEALLRPERLEGLPALTRWIEFAAPVRERLKSLPASTSDAERLDFAVRENTLVQISHLLTHPSVARGVESGRLRLHAWVYQFETGEVWACDRDSGEWLPLRAWAERDRVRHPRDQE